MAKSGGGGRSPGKWLRAGGILLTTIGILLTLWLAVSGSQKEPPSASMQGVIALAGVVAQVGAAWLFSGVGKPDPALADRAVSRLARAGGLAQTVNSNMEELFEGTGDAKTPSERHALLGKLSVRTSFLGEEIIEAIEDWNTFAPDAVMRTGALQARPNEIPTGGNEADE